MPAITLLIGGSRDRLCLREGFGNACVCAFSGGGIIPEHLHIEIHVLLETIFFLCNTVRVLG